MSKSPIIIALDYSDENSVWELLNQFGDEQLFVKVGMELYYSCGNALLSKLKEKGHHIFLDMKLHDILMLWFYLSGLILVVGGEINATLYNVRMMKR